MDITEALIKSFEKRQRAQQSEMVRRGLRLRAEAGLPIGTLPLGYKLRGKKVKVAEPAATHIRTVFRRLSDEGLLLQEAWREATRAGLVSKAGKPLSAAAFLRLVSNPFYAGYIKFGSHLYKGSHEPLCPTKTLARDIIKGVQWTPILRQAGGNTACCSVRYSPSTRQASSPRARLAGRGYRRSHVRRPLPYGR